MKEIRPGMVFGWMVVVEVIGRKVRLKCVCGAHKTLTASRLRNEKSCGCMKRRTWPKGGQRARQMMPCVEPGCGLLVDRPADTYRDRAMCPAHATARRRAYYRAYNKLLRVQAKRYRELRRALGWTEAKFEANLAELKRRRQIHARLETTWSTLN